MSEIGESSQTKEPNETMQSIDSKDETQSTLLKLDVDCLQEVFEWLTMNDLLALGETCQRLRRVTGDFFRSNYVSCRVTADRNGLITRYKPCGFFSDYITKLNISSNRVETYRYVGANCKSLKQIRLEGVLPDGANDGIADVLKYVETMDLHECFFREEFHEFLLKYCVRLKRLSVTRSDKIRNTSVIIGTGNDWLLRKYPTIEHLELIGIYNLPNDELMTFFLQNPNIRSFSTDSRSLWDNRNVFSNNNIAFDTLIIEFTSEEIAYELHNLLNDLFERGVYKKLYVYSTYIAQNHFDTLFAFPFSRSIEMLHGNFWRIDSQLENLTTLGIEYGFRMDDMENLPGKVPNLEQIYFHDASSDHIEPFIRKSPKLRAVKVYLLQGGTHCNQGFFDLSFYNRERAKLPGARKTRIYVNEYLLYSAKWSEIRTDHTFVELGRYEWFEWNEYSAKYRYDKLLYY